MNQKSKEEYPEIRELTRRDRKTLSRLIQAFANRSGNINITEMVPAAKPESSEGKEATKEEENAKIYDLIKNIMDGIIEWAEDELAVWFMDLIGYSDRDAYDALPFDVELHILNQLMEKKGFTGFFSQASGLYSKIRGLIEKQ